ncbi:uncharacterized protein LOC106880638 [Octopus bimaculoides]|nr:uncharacterized protein LOC106880638 [Octopus bimaculoides]|eukprot:XP_014786165.1 PREDICTED: uncharacterized protein LOC106880638 [Octopus bimaculoides]
MSKIKKVASFTVFCNDYKNRLTTAYPFLTLDQIQQKLREKWNDLSLSEKKYYSKAVLCQPMPKSSSKKKFCKQKRSKPTKPESNSQHHNLNELNLYEDDLSGPSDENEDKVFTSSSPTEESSSSSFQRNNSKTYMASRLKFSYSVPVVVDETPFVQQGILKKRCSEKDQKTKVKFNVSPVPSLCNVSELKPDVVNEPNWSSKTHEKTVETSMKEKKETCRKIQGGDGDCRSSTPNVPESKRRSKRLVDKSYFNQKQAHQVFNYTQDWSSSQSDETSPESDLKISASEDLAKSAEERTNKPLTPELQRSMSQLIIQKVCQAPKKKGSRGNSVFTENVACKSDDNDSSTPRSLATKSKKIKGINHHRLLLSEKSDSDEKILKWNANVPIKNSERSSNVTSSKFKCLFSPDESLSSNDYGDNDLESSIEWDFWNNSQEEKESLKCSDSSEKSVTKMKKMVSPSLMTSMISNSPDSMVTECSSPLSGISELSDPDSDSYEEHVEENEKMDSKAILYINDKISAGGDAKSHSIYKCNPKFEGLPKDYPFESMFEEVTPEKRKSNKSRILTAAKMEDNPSQLDIFQDEPLFC